jgi:hypothetical protein
VLLGERLGRRHQRRLVAGFERSQHRVDGDHRLARADLAHQQALHRLAGVEVGLDLVEGLQLIAGRLEGQRIEPTTDQISRLSESRCRTSSSMRPLAGGQKSLVEEQLFEAEPLAGCFDFVHRFRELHGSQRITDTGESSARPQLGR